MLTVVMPAYNEEGYLADAVTAAVDGLRARYQRFELIVCQNGSTDRTAQVAQEQAVIHPEVRVLHHSRADYGLALRAGFLAAQGDVVVNFDVDGVDLDFLDRSMPLMERPDGPVLVVGSKRSPGADDQRSRMRKLVTGAFGTALRLGFGLRVTDTHGSKVLDRSRLAALVAACRFGSDIFDTELVLRAERAGLKVAEMPVIVIEQRPPRSSITTRIPRTLRRLGHLRLMLWMERAGSAGPARAATGAHRPVPAMRASSEPGG